MEIGRFNPEAKISDPKARYLGMLTEMIGWSDEIPAEDIHNGNYKVRKNWWVTIRNITYLILRNCIISDESKRQISNFNDKFSSEEFNGRYTTKEDIAEGNEFVDFLIRELQ